MIIDQIKRKTLIDNALRIPFVGNGDIRIPQNVEEVQKFYQSHFTDYREWCVLPWESYKAAEFWFNNAGFQFKWKNGDMIIILECLSWPKVLKELTQATFESSTGFDIQTRNRHQTKEK